MALQRSERYFPSQATFSFRPQLSLLSENPYPGEQFLDDYQQWMDNPIRLVLPSGVREIYPDTDGMDARYGFVTSTLDEHTAKKVIQGAYGEIVGGFLLHRMVEEAAGGTYTVIPTPPQLDVCGQRRVAHVRDSGLSEPEKTADIILGRVVEVGGEKAIEPLMLFDIKSPPRLYKTSAKIGIGVNVRLTPLPVGIFYVGGMTFVDARGNKRSAIEYIHEVIHPAVLDNSLQWKTIWPDGVSQNPRKQLFQQMCEEALLSCHFTRLTIEKDNWRETTKQRLLQNLADAEAVFRILQAKYA